MPIPKEKALSRGASVRAALLSIAARPMWHARREAGTKIVGHISDEALSFWWEDDDEDDIQDIAASYEVTPEAIALIPVNGVLVDSEPTWWMSYMGYTSTPLISRMLTHALTDARVKSAVLLIDSPGGQVSGLAAACDAAFAWRGSGKKLWGAGKDVCSAAFELGSQCEKLYLTEDGQGGCIGTVLSISDWSQFYAEMGVRKLRITSTGGEEYKGAGMPGTEITPEMEKDFKRQCDEYRTLFNGKIARGLGRSEAFVQRLADGRVYVGANAASLGIFTGIATQSEVLAALGAGETEVPGKTVAVPDSDTDDDTEDRRNTNMSRADKFFAWLQGKDGDDEIPGTTSGNTSNNKEDDKSGDKATDDEVARLKAENARLTTFHSTELENAKTSAKAAAVNAYGQNTPELARAQESIDKMTDIQQIRDFAGLYGKQTPSSIAGQGRQSEGEDISDDAPPATAAWQSGSLSQEKATNLQQAARDRYQRRTGKKLPTK